MIQRRKKRRYRFEGKTPCIEVRVRSAKQLFDARDPAPFRERDLDDEFVEYVVSSAEEFSASTPVKVRIQVSELTESGLSVDEVRQSFAEHFNYEADLKQKHLKKIFKTAQLFFVVGICILILCLFAAELSSFFKSERVQTIWREGFVIIGWVSLWRPVELMLYDWWPLLEKIRVYQKLEASEVEVVDVSEGIKK